MMNHIALHRKSRTHTHVCTVVKTLIILLVDGDVHIVVCDVHIGNLTLSVG